MQYTQHDCWSDQVPANAHSCLKLARLTVLGFSRCDPALLLWL